MIDFSITELLDDIICTLWLERHLHPDGLRCPHCGHSDQLSSDDLHSGEPPQSR